MTQPRFLSFAALAALAAAALPLTAQVQTCGIGPEIPGRAYSPHVVLPVSPEIYYALTPSELRAAYGLEGITNEGAGQIIALVDPNDNPDAESDLAAFDAQYGEPACTTANGCFQLIYATGTQPPLATGGDLIESSMDIESAHAIAPQAKIMLVEAASDYLSDLFYAVRVAVDNGATVVSMSWAGAEWSGELSYDSTFNYPLVTFVAASGDFGHGTYFPAASPYVVTAGGTYLHASSAGVRTGETAWDCSSGGESVYESEPSWQNGVQSSGQRGIPDVAWDAFPGVDAYNELGAGGFFPAGGTSLSAPSWAGVLAIVNSSRIAAGESVLPQPQQSYLYYYAEADYYDIVKGTNGTCGALCDAGPGYDFVTGIGSPRANKLVPALVAAPTVSVSPPSVTFPTQTIGATSVSEAQITVTNTGGVAKLGDPAVSVTAPFLTTSATTCTNHLSLATGATCDIYVKFAPTVAGIFTGTLSVAFKGPNSPHTVALAGTGTAIVFSPSPLYMCCSPDGNPITSLFQYTNVGSTTITFTSAAITGPNAADFKTNVGEPPCGGSLPPGYTCVNVTATFTPSIVGTESATFELYDNSPDSPQTLSLSGGGLTDVTFNPSPLNLGSSPVGTPITAIFSYSNLGPTTITFTNATITGTNAADFRTDVGSPPCGGTLPPGYTCVNITATFTPSIVGPEAATFTLYDSAAGSPQTLSLGGVGTAN